MEALRIIRNLAKNAAAMKKSANESNIPECMRLTGERVALVEELRAFSEAKVPITSSDIKGEMKLLMKDMQEDFSETLSAIKAKSSALLKELGKISGAKRIAAYKIQGGRYGY